MPQTFDLLASIHLWQQELFFKQLFTVVTTKQYNLHYATINVCIIIID